MMVKNNDHEALAQVSEVVSFLIDQTKLTKAFEEASKTTDKVAYSCKALTEIVKGWFTRNLEDWSE
jgi:hypothetical protein